MNTTRAAAEPHSSGGVSPGTRAAAGASASAPPVAEHDVVYTADRICAALARKTFAGALCVVDRCTRLRQRMRSPSRHHEPAGDRLEVKVSRADLKADRKKDKWFDFGRWNAATRSWPKTPRDWPENVWKHYYAIAAPIWRDDLLDHCQPKSGVVTVKLNPDGSLRGICVKRRCTANKVNTPLTPEVVVDIARLASLRMWDAYRELGRRGAARGSAGAAT